MTKIKRLPRYVACGQVTQRPIFVFVSNKVSPNAAMEAFTFADDYSFGILQSDTHWRWFVGRSSTLKGDFRYTSKTVYDIVKNSIQLKGKNISAFDMLTQPTVTQQRAFELLGVTRRLHQRRSL